MNANVKATITVALALIAGIAIAQAPGITRTILQRGDVPQEGAREAEEVPHVGRELKPGSRCGSSVSVPSP